MKLYHFVDVWMTPVANCHYACDGVRFNTYSGYYLKENKH